VLGPSNKIPTTRMVSKFVPTPDLELLIGSNLTLDESSELRSTHYFHKNNKYLKKNNQTHSNNDFAWLGTLLDIHQNQE